MTTDEILALLTGSVSSTGPIANANNQPMLDMLNANKAQLQPIVDQISAKDANINNTEKNFMDYAGNPSPAGMSISDRMLGRESATMPDRLDALKLGLNLGERTLTPNKALDYYNSDLAGQLARAKVNVSGNMGLGDMQASKDDLKSKMDNAAADRAADSEARSIKSGAASKDAAEKNAQEVVNFALASMGKGDIDPQTAFGIIKSNIPDASDDKINMMLGMPAGFKGGVQDYYNGLSTNTDEQKAKNAIDKIFNWR